jgi:hypothetical protein
MAKLLLREALQITVKGADKSVGHYGNGKQTYVYYDVTCKTNDECYLRAKTIHSDLNGHERQIVEGTALSTDVPDDEGLIHV